MALSLGFSPCPNDCFMFDAIVNERIDLEGLSFAPHLADVEALNRETFAGTADVTKLSYHAYAYCRGTTNCWTPAARLAATADHC
jgi:1,4-dihydroxy-6-naphthoate synthase